MESKNIEMSEKAVTYTCPMHPDVVSDSPGNCPRCGMKLVPKRGSQMAKQSLLMLLLCLMPVAVVLLLPVFGVRINATWVLVIVLASCCILANAFYETFA